MDNQHQHHDPDQDNESNANTSSPFSIIELYTHLSKSMKQGSTESKHILELLARGENPTAFFIEYYDMFAMTFNVAFVKTLSSKLERVSCMHKKNIISFASEFVEIAHILHYRTPRSFLTMREHPAPDISIIETLMYNNGKKRFDEIDYLIEEGKITLDMHRIFNTLISLVKHKDKNGVLDILTFLLASRASSALSLDDISYPEIAHIKYQKNDIVWYLWKILMDTCKNPSFSLDLVKDNLILFSMNYQKKYRNQRLTILFFTYVAVCKEGSLYSKGLSLLQKHDSTTCKSQSQTTTTSTTTPTTHSLPLLLTSKPIVKKQKEDVQDSSSRNLDYLKCFTLVDVDAKASVMRDRSIVQKKNDDGI